MSSRIFFPRIGYVDTASHQQLDQLCTVINSLPPQSKYLLIAITSRQHFHRQFSSLCSSFSTSTPATTSRSDLIREKVQKYGSKIADDVNIREISLWCFGLDSNEISLVFSIIDSNLAQCSSIRRIYQSDFVKAINQIKEDQSQSRYLTRIDCNHLPNLEEVVGLEEVKMVFKDLIELPLNFPSLYKTNKVLQTLLLTALPNSGCRFLAQSFAKSINFDFYTLNPSFNNDLQDFWRIVSYSFSLFCKKSNSLLFIENIDQFDCVSNRVLNSIIDGIKLVKQSFKSNLIVIMTSSNPDLIDFGLFRMIDEVLFVHPPDAKERESLIKKYLSKFPKLNSQINPKLLAEESSLITSGNLKIVLNR
ncbi:hypothetical protein P9112_000192 [Eukaryota sp. TZLM1-RC]